MSSTRKYDLIIFGASGFTGSYVVGYLHNNKETNWKIAIAGRSREKLTAVNAKWQANYDIVIADVSDENSLNAMAQTAKVVVDCVGPYRFFGRPVVTACADHGTDYLDISGEPEFLERVELEFNEVAKKNGCTIVSSAGFDSIPADIGTVFTVNQFAANVKLATVESYVSMSVGAHGLGGHYATYDCIVHGFGSVEELRDLRRKQTKVTVPTVGPKLAINNLPHWNADVQGYCLPFPGADASVVKRSQRNILINNAQGVQPVQYAAYLMIPSALWTGVTVAAGAVFNMMATFSWGRSLLLNYPKIFSLGVFSHEGPSAEQLAETKFEMIFVAKGYSGAPQGSPDVTIKTRVAGPEPGYVATPIFVIECARALLRNRDKVPKGVQTPASAFRNTDLIPLLQAHGITFERLQ